MKTKQLTKLFALLLMTVLSYFALPTQAQTVKYNLKIVDQQVTSDNAADILGNGAVSYDVLMNTLTISGDIHDDKYLGIDCKMPDLTIYVANDVTVYSYINFYASATITGPGKLTIDASSNCALYVENATLTIKDAQVDAIGGWGIAGYPENEHLIIQNSYVHAKGWKGAICDFNSFTFDGCEIVDPVGCYVDGREIVDANGYVAEEVTIDKTNEIVTGGQFAGAYWATYYNSKATRVADANTTVYMATLRDDKSELTLNEIRDKIIPAGQAVILKSTATTSDIVLTLTIEYGGGDFIGNALSGCDSPTPKPTDQGTIYTMNIEHEQLGFYKFTGQMLRAHKAYLAINKSNNAPIRVGFDDASGIESTYFTNPTNDDTQWYDLSGRRLNGTPTAPGLYLNNGHKVIMK